MTDGEAKSLMSSGELRTYGRYGSDCRHYQCNYGACIGNTAYGYIMDSVFTVVAQETFYIEGITKPVTGYKPITFRYKTFGYELARWGFTTNHILVGLPTPVYEADDDEA